MSDLDIRPCKAIDLIALEASIPSDGAHERRFLEQEAGSSTYLVAWLGSRPVGHLNMRWGGSRSVDVRRHVDYPEITALEASPRGLGYGTTLVGHAEGLARLRGFEWLCLGVETDNDGARRLYERLGYRDWGHGIVAGSAWRQFLYMTKRIAPT